MNSEQLEVISEIKENCNITESNSNDIATIQDFVGKLVDEKYNTSLMYQVADVQPINGSFGSTYASKRAYKTNDFTIVRKDIHTKTYTINTGYTQEVWQDMQKIFGKRAIKQSSNILGGLSAHEENDTLINLLFNESENKPDLDVNINNSAWITSQISMRVAESVIEMNRYGFKTLDSFCILSPKWASAFLGTAGYVKNDSDSSGADSTLFVGRYGRTDFYVNPFRNESLAFNSDYNDDYANPLGDTGERDDYCYVGLKSKVPGESSLVFSPYLYEGNMVLDPETGNNTLFIYNRYGVVTNPLHTPIEAKSMLHKFLIKEA